LLFYLEDDTTRRLIYLLRTIDLRSRLFIVDAMIEDSYDRYLTIRESYLQRREFLIYDGEPPEDDDFYDDFYDEDFEEDEQTE